ncbi:MAG: hypothetical protein PSV13_15470 [Lacunisphaera sp.]|nr:hypothetical protein [Lacunisphaera sp.]
MIIAKHRGALDKIAEALLENETIEGRHVLEIIEHGEIKSPILTVKPSKLAAEASKAAEKTAAQEQAGSGGTTAPSPA